MLSKLYDRTSSLRSGSLDSSSHELDRTICSQAYSTRIGLTSDSCANQEFKMQEINIPSRNEPKDPILFPLHLRNIDLINHQVNQNTEKINKTKHKTRLRKIQKSREDLLSDDYFRSLLQKPNSFFPLLLGATSIHQNPELYTNTKISRIIITAITKVEKLVRETIYKKKQQKHLTRNIII